MKNKGEDVEVAKDLTISLLRVILMLIIFVVGVVIGLASTSHIKWGDLPLLQLWERFFDGQDVNKYSIYVHSLPGYVLSVSNTSVFYKRQIPSQKVIDHVLAMRFSFLVLKWINPTFIFLASFNPPFPENLHFDRGSISNLQYVINKLAI
ncbi:hypothetical protein A4A49_01344 [Nicotiana attenuata]|uniref:Uncharacterized protein n=1 Tax=Nicotiana attenuata TaxID=49451 RepID=A0A314LC34_NICAT|nr:hypothetical protein A4A49_01344 [Nicotiana attenuata]